MELVFFFLLDHITEIFLDAERWLNENLNCTNGFSAVLLMPLCSAVDAFVLCC